MRLPNVDKLQANLHVTADGILGPVTLQAMMRRLSPIAPDGAGRALYAELVKTAPWNRLRLIYLLANIDVECDFQTIEENLSYSARRICEVWPTRYKTEAAAAPCAYNPQALANAVYGGRMGNVNVGDGWKYRGRGWPQLTGRDAYTIVGGAVGRDFVANPDQLLTLAGSAAAAVGFWTWKKIGPLADRDDLVGVRVKWNGGGHGLDLLRSSVAILKKVWPE